MDQVLGAGHDPSAQWIWHGYLGRGSLTLMTSIWKSGKTTLITGLLQQLGAGGEFLGRRCAAGKALVVSEEPLGLWAERLAVMPVGPHVHLI